MNFPLPLSGVRPKVTLQIVLPDASPSEMDESAKPMRDSRSGFEVTNRSTFDSFRSWIRWATLSKSAGRS